jgi:L-amino acid N-acyltransferase YncA
MDGYFFTNLLDHHGQNRNRILNLVPPNMELRLNSPDGGTTLELILQDKIREDAYVAMGSLRQFPCNEYTAISLESFVYTDYRRRGHGTRLNYIKRAIAKAHNYSTMLCTVSAGNEGEIKLLEKCGWWKLAQFKNTTETSYPTFSQLWMVTL